MRRHRLALWLAAVIVGFAASSAAKADTVTFETIAGGMTSGGPVDATAQFTTSGGTLTLILTNKTVNPTDVAQCISDLSFTLSNGTTLTALTGASSSEITVNGGGTTTTGATLTTPASVGWVFSGGGTSSGLLDVLSGAGHAGPAHLIIGPPDGGGTYSAANGSIASNPPHNPFLNQSATFMFSLGGVTSGATVTGATFSFGTTEGANNVPGTLTTHPVPAPPALVLGLVGVAGLFGKRAWARKRTPEMA
jgi:hypothetical protein